MSKVAPQTQAMPYFGLLCHALTMPYFGRLWLRAAQLFKSWKVGDPPQSVYCVTHPVKCFQRSWKLEKCYRNTSPFTSPINSIIWPSIKILLYHCVMCSHASQCRDNPCFHRQTSTTVFSYQPDVKQRLFLWLDRRPVWRSHDCGPTCCLSVAALNRVVIRLSSGARSMALLSAVKTWWILFSRSPGQ